MKKLMFVAALSATIASFGAEAENFEGDGIYTVTITQKSLDVTYADVEDAEPVFDPEESGEYLTYQDAVEEPVYGMKWTTSAQAKAGAQDYFKAKYANEYNLKSISVSKKSLKDDEGNDIGYGFRIKYVEQDPDTVAKAKTVSMTAAGILVKGSYKAADLQDGALILWNKSKDYRTDNGKYYKAYSYPAAKIAALVRANKSVGAVEIPVSDDICVKGAGIGTASGEIVKSVAGQIVTTVDDYSEIDPSLIGYGTWKVQKDSSATKLAAKGYSLEQILNKKGAQEIGEIE